MKVLYRTAVLSALSCVVVGTSLGATPTVTPAATPTSSPTVIASFDHTADQNTLRTVTIDVAPGKQFSVQLKNTCKNIFGMKVDGIENEEVAAAKQALDKQQAQARQDVQDAAATVARDSATLQQQQSSLDAMLMAADQLQTFQASSQISDAKSAAADVRSLSLPRPLADQLSAEISSAKSKDARRKVVSDYLAQLDDQKRQQQEDIARTSQALDAAQQKLNQATAALNNPPAATCTAATDTITTNVTYNSKYGAYEVAITRQDKQTGPYKVSDTLSLYPTTDIVVTPSSPWSTIFSAGVVVSSLTNPKYSLQPGPTAGSPSTVVEDKSSEDKVSAGLAAFVTVTHRKWSFANDVVHVGATFGIGTSTNMGSKIEYFPGVSFQMGPLITTLGANIGSVDTLPSGLKVGSTTTQANALGTLGTRTAVGAFVSLSWTFLGSGAQTSLTSALSPTPAPANPNTKPSP